jgi:hypothetical protein
MRHPDVEEPPLHANGREVTFIPRKIKKVRTFPWVPLELALETANLGALIK